MSLFPKLEKVAEESLTLIAETTKLVRQCCALLTALEPTIKELPTTIVSMKNAADAIASRR